MNVLELFRVATPEVQLDVVVHHGDVITGELRSRHVARGLSERGRTIRNHSATHLMHKALREVLGEHVQQKGSLVDADKTRFDFAHNAPLTDEQIRKVEAIVNREIVANMPTEARVMAIDDAKKTGAMIVKGTPSRRISVSTSYLLSKCGMPVARSAPATDE